MKSRVTLQPSSGRCFKQMKLARNLLFFRVITQYDDYAATRISKIEFNKLQLKAEPLFLLFERHYGW